MMHQDYGESRKLLKQIWEERIYIPNIDPDYARSRMIILVSIISISYKERFGVQSFSKPQKHLKEMYKFADDMLAGLDQKQSAADGGQRTVGKIREYILAHATEPSITVGSISEYFHLSAAYASSMFKKYTGEGILDAIHKERIRQAKDLLKGGMSVQATAQKIGYLDARGFIRTFKKYEGITPGQYKNT